MKTRIPFLIIFAMLIAFVSAASGLAVPARAASDLPVYPDALASGWQDWSYGEPTTNYANTSPVHGETNSIAAAANLAGCSLFPSNNIWNTRIDSLPVNTRSDQWVNTIGRTTGFHMDFGSGTWDGGPIGIPYNLVDSSVTGVSVSFYFDDQSDPSPYPIPTSPLIEYGSDHHILMLNSTNCHLYEIYDASYSGGNWEAGSGAIWDLNSNALRPAGWTSADAAGLPMLPGLVRYDEILSGQINHAIRFTASQTNGYIWPARHLTSNNPGAPQIPPMGARFRLKSSYNISGFPAEIQVILRAMKQYGIILADNGSNWYVSGAPDERWDNDHLHLLDVLTGNDFEAVDSTGLILNPDSGAVNLASLTISGNAGTGGATLTYTGGSTTANASGSYMFSVTSGWTGTITPSKTGYTFTPASITISSPVTTNLTGQNFTAALAADKVAVYRRGTGGAYWLNYDFATASFTNYLSLGDGGSSANCYSAPMDFDGDGVTERTHLCGGGWHFFETNGAFVKSIFAYMQPGDLPVPGDYNGDGKDEVAVYRRITGGAYWLFYDFATASFTNYVSLGDGGSSATCYPAAMDFDGDGVDELTHLCGGGWHFFETNGAFVKSIFAYMQPGDMPIPGDYNGDGKDNVAVYRRVTGGAYWLNYDFATASFTNYLSFGDGGTTAACYPTAMDFDADGIDERTHLCGGGWHFFETNGAFVKSIFAYMQVGDKPVPGKYGN